jgi:flagellin FlaB
MVGNITCIRGNDSDALSDTIDLIGLQTGVSEDSLPVNLSKLVLTVDDGSRSNTLTYAGSSELSDLFDDSTTVFIAEAIRDEDNSFTTTSPVMNKGDLILIYVSTLSDTNLTSVFESGDLDEDPEASGLFIDPKTIVSVTFTYETEALVSYSFKIPASYGDDKQISLG